MVAIIYTSLQSNFQCQMYLVRLSDEIQERFTADKGWRIIEILSVEFLSRVAPPVPATCACMSVFPYKPRQHSVLASARMICTPYSYAQCRLVGSPALMRWDGRWSQRTALSPNACASRKRIQRLNIFRYNHPCPTRPPAMLAIPLGYPSPTRLARNATRGTMTQTVGRLQHKLTCKKDDGRCRTKIISPAHPIY